MPEVMQLIASLAPGVSLISHLTDGRRASDVRDAGEIELAVGVFLEAPSWQRRRALFDWTFVCVFNPQQVKVTDGNLSMEQ